MFGSVFNTAVPVAMTSCSFEIQTRKVCPFMQRNVAQIICISGLVVNVNSFVLEREIETASAILGMHIYHRLCCQDKYCLCGLTCESSLISQKVWHLQKCVLFLITEQLIFLIYAN